MIFETVEMKRSAECPICGKLESKQTSRFGHVKANSAIHPQYRF
jgi:hypothetical protein